MTQVTQMGQAPAASSFWLSPAGATVLAAYETVVYNEYVDLDDWLQVLGVLLFALILWRQCDKCCFRRGHDGERERRRRRRGGYVERDGGSGSGRRFRKVRPAELDSSSDDDGAGSLLWTPRKTANF